MKKLTLSIAICTLFLATSVQAQWSSKNRIKGNGNITSEKRITKEYDEISVAGFFDVDLVSGKEGTITIEGEQNLLQYVKVEVKDNTLKIYTENNKNLSTSSGKTIRITVPFESISAVALAGSGDINSKKTIKSEKFKAKLAGSGDINLNIDATTAEVVLSGSGDIVISGTTSSVSNQLSGSGDVDTSKLKAKTANATLSGSGDMILSCSESINAKISGSGNIKYSGNPEKKDTKVSGSGKISKV